MNKIKDKRIRRAYIRKKLKFLFSVLCLVLALVLTVLGVRRYKHDINHPIAFETVESTGVRTQMRLASFELEQVPEKIGKLDGVTYYLVYKEGCNNEFCILTMENKDYDKIVNAIAKEGKIVIEGPLDLIGSDDESEVFDFVDAYVKKNNITPKRKGKKPEDYMRDISLEYDSERSTLSKILNTSLDVIVAVFVLALYGLASVGDDYKAFRIAGSLQPAGRQYADMINRELLSPDAHWYHAAKTYVTENYLIVVDKGLSFFLLSNIKDIYIKTTGHISIGGETYLYECAIGYADGQVYEAQARPIHFLQSKLRDQYEMQLEQIIEAVSARNENVKIHIME